MKKQIISSLVLLSTMAYSGGAFVEVTEPVEPVIEIQTVDKKDLFVFAAGGGAFFDVKSKLASGDSFIQGALDDTGVVFEVGAGYKVNENIFMELAYQRSALEIADVDTGYLSINYLFPETVLNPYVGVLAGYSRLKWSQRPHVMILNEDLTSDSGIYGFQAGADIALSESLSFGVKYQYIVYDHFMDIQDGRSTIAHESAQNILAGLKYSFW
jgi:opacity protein-like surface antigen